MWCWGLPLTLVLQLQPLAQRQQQQPVAAVCHAAQLQLVPEGGGGGEQPAERDLQQVGRLLQLSAVVERTRQQRHVCGGGAGVEVTAPGCDGATAEANFL